MTASVLARLTAIEQQAAAAIALATRPLLTAVQLAEAAGLTLDPWQRDILESDAPRVLMNVTRQGGKSTVAAVLAVHSALTEGGLVLVLSPTPRQSQETFRKCLDVYGAAGATVEPEAETKLTLELANGGRIVSLPGKEQTIRGYSGVRLLLIDEAARVEDALYYSVRPMLAVSGGRIVTLSTPFGRRGWWATAWHADERWLRVHITAEQCPRISPAFLAEEERTLGWWWFHQEYFGAFLDAQTAAFRSEDVDRAFADEVEPWTL